MTKLVWTERKAQKRGVAHLLPKIVTQSWIDLRCSKLDRKKIGIRRRGAQLKKILDPDGPR